MANVRKFMRKYCVRQFMAYFIVFQMLFGLPMQIVRAATPVVGSYDPSTAGISQTTNTTTVNLLAEQAIINWDNFDTIDGELLEFLRNNGLSPFAVLNKVSGGPTMFEGNLEAIKGTVFILNPDGITFAPTAYVTARNLVASSMKMKDSDFLEATEGATISGDMKFTNPCSYEGARLVANRGTIEADSTYLVGKNVLNAGTITANAGGLVAMVAGDEMILGKPGSDVIVKKLVVNKIENHTVDNGAIGGASSNLNIEFGINESGNSGSVSAPGGDLVLAAGDIWSNAIENVQELTATAHGDIHLEVAINITGDMRAEAGLPTEYEEYLDICSWSDGYYTVERGGDVLAADTITAGGNIDIIANGVQLDAAVEATTGDLKIAGRQSKDPVDGYHDVENAALTAGGDIEISSTGGQNEHEWVWDGYNWIGWHEGHWESTSGPIPGDITLNGDVIAGGNLTLFNNTNVTGPATLQAGVDIILENGEAFYQNCDTLTGTDKLTLDAKTGQIDQGTATISVTGSELIMRQAPTLNLVDRNFDLQDTTHLTLESYNGSVFATDAADGGKDENAADQWASIGAKANGGIILSGHENDIKARRLQAAHGPIEVDAKTKDILANDHGFTGDDGILASGGGNITLTGNNVRVVGNIDAEHGPGIRPVGYNSDLTVEADDDIVIDGYADIDGDMVLHANMSSGDGDMTATGNLTAGGSIDIYSSDTTTFLGGDRIEATDDITLHNDTELNGGALQKIKALTGQLYTDGSVHKTNTGDLEMFGGYNGPLYPDMDYSVKTQDVTVDDGELSIAGNATVKLEGSIYSSGEMTLAANADGIPSTPSQAPSSSSPYSYDQLIHSSGTIQSLNGDVDLSAQNSTISLNGGSNPTDAYVSAGGDILIRNYTWVQESRKLQAGDDIVLAEGKRLQGMGSLSLIAGDDIIIGSTDVDYHWLAPEDDTGAPSEVRTHGDLILNAVDDVYVHGKLTTHDGSGGNIEITASDDTIHLYGDVTADQTDGGDIILHANTEIADGVTLDAGHNVEAFGTLHGHGSLTALADDDIMLKENVSSVGAMIMDAGSNIELNTTSGNTSSDSTITLSAGDEVIIGKPYSGGGNVTADGHMEISAGDDWNDDVLVYGKLTTLADSGGNIDVTAGDDITIWGTDNGPVYESVEADGVLTMSSNTSGVGFLGGDLYIAGDAIAESMQLEAGAGGPPDYSPSHVKVDGSLQTTGGDMVIRAHHDVLLGGNVDSAGNLVLNADRHGDYGYPEPHVYGGDVEVEGTIFADGTIDMYGNNITLWDNVTSTDDMTITADTSPDYDYQTDDPVGDVFAYGMLTSTEGSIEISASDDTIYLGDDVKAAVDVTLNNNTEFFSDNDQKVDAQTGTITAKGWLWKNSCLGSLYLEAAGDISLADDVEASWGGVSIISKQGKIFTPDKCGYETDTLNIGVYGWSDDSLGDGVVLPHGPGLAAIVISSAVDLKLGRPDAALIAEGIYDDTGTVDDREGVDFLDEPLTAIGGIIRDEGEPIDVAVYLASITGDVDVESQEVYVESPGTMVVDAYDTVTLGDLTSEPAIQTLEVREGRFWSVDRLEVVSRITEWLFEASIYGRLPYPYNPEIVEAFIGGDYILRGAGLGNPLITDGRAWVLEDPIPAPPLYSEAGEASEEEEFAEGGCPALMEWLAVEIGVPADEIQVVVEGAFALSTDIQPCEMCARLMAASNTLQDPDGTQIAAMIQVLNELVTTPAPPSPEQMTSIAAALAEHVDDGTYYASAGQWIDALVAYVSILNTEMGYSATDAVALADKYLTSVTEAGNATLTAYVQARLAALGG